MEFKSNKKLRKLENKEFAEDIKKYIKSNHEFYSTRVPEIKVLAKRLNEEYKLRGFYKVFNKFWKTGYNNERSLAIYTLELYREEFNIETWKFFKQKLKDIKSWDKVDDISVNIIGEIFIRSSRIEGDLIKMASSNNIWFKRMSLMASIPLIRNDRFDFAMNVCDICIHSKDERVQQAVAKVLNDIAIKKPNVVRKFITNNSKLFSKSSFYIATENLRDLRHLRSENNKIIEKMMFWK